VVDWRVDLATVRELVGARIALQGKRRPVRRSLVPKRACGRRHGECGREHRAASATSLNLGHGILAADTGGKCASVCTGWPGRRG